MPLINLRELGKVGGNLATIGGAAVAGYGEDKADALKEALQQAVEQRAARKAQLDEQMSQKLLATLHPGEKGYGVEQGQEARDAAPGLDAAAVSHINATAQPTANAKALELTTTTPAEAAKAAAIDTAKAPIEQATHRANRITDAQNPESSFTSFQDTDPATGQPRTRVLNTHTGQVVTEGGGKASAAGGGANGPQMAAAKANYLAAIKTMDDYEAKLASGQANYRPFDATRGALGSSEQTQNAKGIFGPLESFIGNEAGASLRTDNPELANYLKAKKFLAEAALNTHKRPNQTQFEIEQELSGIGPRSDGFTSEDAKTQIAQSAERRKRFGSEVFGIGADQGGGGTPKIGSREAAVAHLRAQGKSDADILRTLGPP